MRDFQCCCENCPVEAMCDEANDDNVCPYSHPVSTGTDEDQKLD